MPGDGFHREGNVRWHVVVPATAAGALGAAALALGVVLPPTPSTHLLVVYLVTGTALGVITALVMWAVECNREGQDAIRAGQDAIRVEIRAAADRVHGEVRAGNLYDSLMREPPSSPRHRLHSVKPTS